MPILVLLERTYVAMCDATRVYNMHSCLTCSVILLYCVQSGMYICCMGYPKDIVLLPVMLTPITVSLFISTEVNYCILIDCLESCACGVPGLSSQNYLCVNRLMTSLQIPQHATTRLLGVPRLLSVPLDTSTSCSTG